MVRLLVAAITYIVAVNRTPVATFDTFRGMNRWVQDYKSVHKPNAFADIYIYKCQTYDMNIEKKCHIYKVSLN